MPSENPEMQPTPVEQDAIPIARVAKPPRPKPAGKWVRIPLVAIGGMLAVVFGIALYLNPYNADGTPRTMATHTTLGLPPCNFVLMTGKPCPSCGMTTSFSLLVRGDVGASLKANWVGTTLAVGWAGLLVWCFASAIAAPQNEDKFGQHFVLQRERFARLASGGFIERRGGPLIARRLIGLHAQRQIGVVVAGVHGAYKGGGDPD